MTHFFTALEVTVVLIFRDATVSMFLGFPHFSDSGPKEDIPDVMLTSIFSIPDIHI